MTHPELVKGLVKDGAQIKEETTAEQANLWHLSSALNSEAGELFDAFKKNIIYRQPLNMNNVIEEMGDIEFFLEGLRQGLGLTREQCLENNIAKLSERYGQKYSDKAAQERKDKA